MKKILFLLAVALISYKMQAQITLWDDLRNAAMQDSAVEEETLSDTTAFDQNEAIFIPESLDSDVDNLLNSWHVNYYTKRAENREVSYERGSDAVYIDRLSRLPRIIELPYNEVIRNCIDLYVDRRRNLIEYMLGLADFYFPMIEQTLDQHGLPLELKYLAAVESALNPTALSRAGACGLWQFMLPTGKSYGLEINSLVDERRDPVKSTQAACQYFQDMYAIYGDWNLVIAAYNCGPGNVNKAIKRAKGSRDYWEIYPYLPRETRSYLPLFIAANYAMNYYSEHNLYPVQTELPVSTDTVMVNRQIHFDQISEILKMDKEQIRALNPQYKLDIIPGNSRPYALLLPAVYAYNYVEKEDEISQYRAEELFANRVLVGKGVGSSKEKLTHQVTSGETVVTIANIYGVTATNIRKWNGLKSNKVKKGRLLTLYVDNGGYALTSKEGELSAEDQTTTLASDSHQNNQPAKNVSSASYKKYKVKSGDSFYTIAKKFPGFNARDLMQLNNMKSSSLKVGQYIRVPSV